MADIFGDTPTPLDTSSESLEWEPDTTQVPPESAEPEVDDELDDDLAEVDADDVEIVDEDDEDDTEGDEPDDDTEPDADLPDDLVGKDASALAKIIADQRAAYGRQGDEIGELRQMLQQALNRPQEPAEKPQAELPTINVEANPQGAYFAALKAVDDNVADASFVEDVIAATEELNPRLARQMERDFDRRMIRAEMAAENAAKVAPLQAANHEQSVSQATSDLYASDPDAPAYAAEVVRMVKEPKGLAEEAFAQAYKKAGTRADIGAALKAALVYAKGNDPTKSKAYVDALDKLKGEGQVESGNAPDEPTRKSAADLYRESVFNTKTRDPGANLFN